MTHLTCNSLFGVSRVDGLLLGYSILKIDAHPFAREGPEWRDDEALRRAESRFDKAFRHFR